jgi:hypothetical protein
LPVEPQEFLARKPVVKAEQFWQKAEFASHLEVLNRTTQDARRAGRWMAQPQEHLDRRGFARTVRPEKPKNLTSGHLERQVRDGDMVGKGFVQVRGLNGERHAGRLPRGRTGPEALITIRNGVCRAGRSSRPPATTPSIAAPNRMRQESRAPIFWRARKNARNSRNPSNGFSTESAA